MIILMGKFFVKDMQHNSLSLLWRVSFIIVNWKYIIHFKTEL